jgi:hypothetical protein
MNIPDNFSQWASHDREQEALLDKLPQCEETKCGKTIQDDFYYEIDGEILCEDCMNRRYRKNTEDFVNS